MSLSQASKAKIVTGSRQSQTTGAAQELENTVARFQASLTDDDRIKLQKMKGIQYDTRSIITFTAELDGADPRRRGKSIATRLATLLQIIQQFVPVVDTFIQSNPDLAALIWGAMRVTFLLLANFTSYFESFVELLNGFGALSSRFKEYQFIFTQSTNLKESIFKFHTSVILCCERIVTIVRRPFRKQALKALTNSFQSEIRTYVDDIKSKAEDVAQEIQLAKAKSDYHEQQLQGKERTEAASSRKQFLALMSRSRSDIRQIKEQGKKQEEREHRNYLLKRLCSYDHNTAFNNARSKRHLGTAEWIFEMDEYKEWYTSDTSGVLHVTGKIGSGKSILASHVVEYLYQQRGTNVFISYFFLRFDDVASVKCDMIIRSLVHQILCTVPMDAIGILLASDIMNCLKQISPQQSNLGSLEKLFFKLLTLCKDWFIVLDGVDECHPSEQDQLCKFLSSVSTKTPESHNVKIWISGRETTQVLVDRSFSSVARLVAGSSHTSSDIKVYAEEVLQSKVSSMQLVVRDANIIDEIIQIIIAKEEGMFLWVFFTIEDLCSCKSDKDIREALLDIPMDLPAIFNRALGRIVQQRHQTIAQNVFKLSAAARRPLTLPELSEALSLKPGQNRLNPDGLINGIERVSFWCENLIHIEKTDNTVHFSHQSIREFFLRPGAYPFHDFHFELEDADSYIAKICLTYLNLDDFETSLVKKDDPGPRVNFEIPVSSIAGQAIQTAARGGIGNRMGRWINLKSASNVSIGQCSIPVRTSYYTRDSIISTNRPFWNYAANNWCFHDANISCKHEPKVWEYLGTVLEEPQLNLNTPWMDIEWRSAFIAKRQPVYDYDDILNGKREWPWQLLGYMQDKTDLWANLAFAVLFAHDTNHTLACQALFNLGRLINEKPQYIVPLLELCLDFNAEHIYCPNQCVQTAFEILDKPSQLYVLASCIAFGAKSWPAFQRSRPSSRTKSDFVESSIVEDLSILLENGYEAREQPLMRAATIMSLYKTRPLTLESLSIASRTEPQVLFESKTPTGKSILEIAIGTKQVSGMSVSLIQSFSRHGGWLDLGSTGNIPHEERQLITKTFYTAMRCGNPDAVTELARLCCAFSCPYPQDRNTYYQIFDQAFRYLWLSSDATQIVTTFYHQIDRVVLGEFCREIFELAVKHNNWHFAGVISNLEMEYRGKAHVYGSARFDQMMQAVNQSYQCGACWIKMDTSFEETNLLEGMEFNWCSYHKRLARVVMSSGAKYMPSVVLSRLQLVSLQQELEDRLGSFLQSVSKSTRLPFS
ncbi:hypothetical protein BFJ63_vAg17756 [Fusarium oxysporum f. sp. narcissi]|uniref:NACHT domain-containing protein n=1 Tax=Fusarium oxysporum f. sp. narcissi TaxID=451672 RepID=A0A4Q2UY48_FUSOX|nr:hypothetical protein BFJ63_vAg17756 [Fusarium oxysporum f. sp. narcissi]